MTTPLLPDDYLAMLNSLWSARELCGPVVTVVPKTTDEATLVIKPGWGWRFDQLGLGRGMLLAPASSRLASIQEDP